jgi:hypothetical protein
MTTHDEQTTTTPVAADEESSVPSDADSSAMRSAPIAATDEPAAEAAQPPQATAESSTTGADASTDMALFADTDRSSLHSRWDDVQASFVDDPKECVQKADALVADVVKQLTAGFSDARARLEAQWARGEEASTEDLRQALKRYREFFERLLAA